MSRYEGLLHEELVAAAARLNESSKHLWRSRLGITTIGATLLAVATPAAVAFTGGWRPFTEPDGLRRLSQDQVIASGDAFGRGPWRLVTSRSSVGQCLEVRFDAPQGGTPKMAGACGIPNRPHVASLGSGADQVPSMLFGRASLRAQTAEVAVAGVVSKPATPTLVSGGQRYSVVFGPPKHAGVCVVTRDGSGNVVDAFPVVAAERPACANRD